MSMQGLTGNAVPDSVMCCAGSAVVVERGGCTFMEKAQALSAAHAAAMIVYNTEEGPHPFCFVLSTHTQALRADMQLLCLCTTLKKVSTPFACPLITHTGLACSHL